MKNKRSISVLKKYSNFNLNHHLLYKDPCFTNQFEGVVLQKDVYTRNLYKRHLGNNCIINKPKKLIKINCSRNGPNEVIISPYFLKNKTDNNIFNSTIEQNKQIDYSNPFKRKYGEFNFGSRNIQSNFSLKKSFSIFNIRVPIITSLDNYNVVLHRSIDKIDEKYKKKLSMLEPLPKLFVNNKGFSCDMIKNKYIKAKLKY